MVPIICLALPLIICLALFTTQLSYKFYQFSSFPVGKVAGSTLSHHPVRADGQMIPELNEHGKIMLLLDKRYDLKHLFTLFVPSTQYVLWAGVKNDDYVVSPWKMVLRIPLITSLRGPPVLLQIC